MNSSRARVVRHVAEGGHVTGAGGVVVGADDVHGSGRHQAPHVPIIILEHDNHDSSNSNHDTHSDYNGSNTSPSHARFL